VLFIKVIVLMYTCGVIFLIYIFIYVIFLIYTFIYVIFLLYMLIYMIFLFIHSSFSRVVCAHVHTSTNSCVACLIHMCDMTHLHVLCVTLTRSHMFGKCVCICLYIYDTNSRVYTCTHTCTCTHTQRL